MQSISHYQVRGVPGQVQSSLFDGRRVDYWGPQDPSHLLIAHDGQNVFDPKTATRRRTWKMAQTAIKAFDEHGLRPPLIIGIFHSSDNLNPHGRFKDLTPQDAFQGPVPAPADAPFPASELHGNKYQSLIAEEIVPAILKKLEIEINFENRAMIGSSMGGLATLNALTLRPDFFATALAFSPHWVIGGNSLVDEVLNKLPKPGLHKVWMSRGDKKLDATYEANQNYADKLMRDLGWQKHYRSTIFKNAGHNERAWSKQLHKAFDFWLKN